MVRWTHLAVFLVLACTALADNVTFLRIDKSVIIQKLEQVPATPADRVRELRAMFERAGCPKDKIEVQTVPDQQLPNLFCTLPGTEYGTILVSARLEYDSRGDENLVGWGGVAMLPLLAESLNSTVHRHTLIFAAFPGGNCEGAAWFWKSLSDAQKREFRGVVDLDHIGRTAPAYSTNSHGAVMAQVLPASARALRYSDEPKSVDEVPEGNAAFFQAHATSFSSPYRPSCCSFAHSSPTALWTPSLSPKALSFPLGSATVFHPPSLSLTHPSGCSCVCFGLL